MCEKWWGVKEGWVSSQEGSRLKGVSQYCRTFVMSNCFLRSLATGVQAWDSSDYCLKSRLFGEWGKFADPPDITQKGSSDYSELQYHNPMSGVKIKVDKVWNLDLRNTLFLVELSVDKGWFALIRVEDFSTLSADVSACSGTLTGTEVELWCMWLSTQKTNPFCFSLALILPSWLTGHYKSISCLLFLVRLICALGGFPADDCIVIGTMQDVFVAT